MSLNNKSFLGEILVEDGIISRDQLNIALKIQAPARITGRKFVKLGVVSACELYIALEALLANILMDLGYADERGLFGINPIAMNSDHPKHEDTL